MFFWPDYPLDAASAQTSLEDRVTIVMRVSDFSTWDPGNRHNAISAIWALLLEPIRSTEGMYQRIGLVRIPRLNAMADIEGFDQRTICLA